MGIGNKISEIEAMRMGVDYSFPIALRGFTLNVRPLANSEFTQCYSAVAEQMRRTPEHQRTKIVEDNYLAREFLKKASAEYGKYPGSLTDPILDEMTNDEIMYLYKEWLAVCDKVNPQLENMPADRIKAIVEDIKKNPRADLDSQLTELSFGQIRSILSYLLTKGD